MEDSWKMIRPNLESWEAATPVDGDQIKELDFLMFHNSLDNSNPNKFALYLVVRIEELGDGGIGAWLRRVAVNPPDWEIFSDEFLLPLCMKDELGYQWRYTSAYWRRIEGKDENVA